MPTLNAGRLLHPVTLSSVVLAVSYGGGGPQNVSLTDGTYYHSCDNQSDDLLAHIEARLAAVLGGTWTLDINGVTMAIDEAHPVGALRITVDSGDFIFAVTSFTGTIATGGDPGGFGVAQLLGARTTDIISASSVAWGVDPHLGGWYPQPTSLTDDQPEEPRKAVLREGRLYAVPDSEIVESYSVTRAEWAQVYSPLMRQSYADSSAWAATALPALTAGCRATLETWGGIVVTMGGGPWRVYPRIDATAYLGPLYLDAQSELWDRPLALSTYLTGYSLYTAAWEGRTLGT